MDWEIRNTDSVNFCLTSSLRSFEDMSFQGAQLSLDPSWSCAYPWAGRSWLQGTVVTSGSQWERTDLSLECCGKRVYFLLKDKRPSKCQPKPFHHQGLVALYQNKVHEVQGSLRHRALNPS